MTTGRKADVERIRSALARAREVVAPFLDRRPEVERKSGGDPVTAADRALDEALRSALPRAGEGWLSEETRDDRSRLGRRRVWIVDPLDGTKEFVRGIPEWCVSIALVEDGRAVAGGLLNPLRDESVLGAIGLGVWKNGRPARARETTTLDGAEVLASRSEVSRGEWERFSEERFRVVPTGSVAYKLGRVASGEADATWTLVAKHEWDVAGGTALVLAAGGKVFDTNGLPPRFNRDNPKLAGLVACAPGIERPVRELLGIVASPA